MPSRASPMSGKITKWEKLVKQLTTGPGAVKLGTGVKGILFRFSRKQHHQARNFWKEYAPKLHYANPEVYFQLERGVEITKPECIITLEGEKQKELDLLGLKAGEIYEKIIKVEEQS